MLGGSASHDRLWNYLSHQVPDSDLIRAGLRRTAAGEGLRLKSRRMKAEYQLGSNLGRTERVDAIREATSIIKTLDALGP